MKLLHNKNVLAGLMFMVFGGAFFIGALNYSLGTGARMGPGYFPRMLGGLLFVLGAIIAVEGYFESKKGEDTPIGWHIMPMVWLLGAVGAFGVLLAGIPAFGVPAMGLVAAAASMIIIASIAARDKKWSEIIISAVALSAFCALAFVKGLGLQMKLFPWS
jgi:Tripartite tricarboxylate transporter TctB family